MRKHASGGKLRRLSQEPEGKMITFVVSFWGCLDLLISFIVFFFGKSNNTHQSLHGGS
jgi:hypothetical protein